MKTLLLGDNAFIGVSHLTQARAREKVESLNVERMVSVLDTALSSGASGYTFTAHPTNYDLIKKLGEKDECRRAFDFYPVLPYAEGYARLANERGIVGLVKDIMGRLPLSGKASMLMDGGLSAVSFDPNRMLKAYLDMELGAYLKVKPRMAKLKAVFLHEVITDLGISFGASKLLESFMAHVRDEYKAQPGFVTRNFVRFLDFFQRSNLNLKDVAIMAPMNKIGFQMNPSKEACEASLAQLKGGDVFAISILAAGYLKPHEAFEYVRGLPNLSGVVVGVSSEAHAKDTFSSLREWADT